MRISRARARSASPHFPTLTVVHLDGIRAMTHSVSPLVVSLGHRSRVARLRACACLAMAIMVMPAAAWADRGAHAARVADDLRTRAAAGATDVILHGSPDDIYALAARHGLSVKKTLRSGAVVSLSAAQLAAVSADP